MAVALTLLSTSSWAQETGVVEDEAAADAAVLREASPPSAPDASPSAAGAEQGAGTDWGRVVKFPDLRERERLKARAEEAEQALERERARHREEMDALARRYDEQIRQERRQADEAARNLREEVERLRSEREMHDAEARDRAEHHGSPDPSLIRRKDRF